MKRAYHSRRPHTLLSGPRVMFAGGGPNAQVYKALQTTNKQKGRTTRLSASCAPSLRILSRALNFESIEHLKKELAHFLIYEGHLRPLHAIGGQTPKILPKEIRKKSQANYITLTAMTVEDDAAIYRNHHASDQLVVSQIVIFALPVPKGKVKGVTKPKKHRHTWNAQQ